MSGRQQTVKFNGINSVLKNITCGVPQGSILGPLLFLTYINDLGAVSQITFPITDDTNIFIQGKDLQKNKKDLNIEIKNCHFGLKLINFH